MQNVPSDVDTAASPTDPFVRVVCSFPSEPDEVEVHVYAATKQSTGLFSTDGLANWAYNDTGVDRAELKRKADDLAPGEVVVLRGNGQVLAVRGAEVEGSSDALILVAGGDGSRKQLSAVADAVQAG